MKIPLTKEEVERIVKNLERKRVTAIELNKLIALHNEAIDNAETAWSAASLAWKLANPEHSKVVIPTLLSDDGDVNVRLSRDNMTAEWMDAHELKRIAHEVPIPNMKMSGKVIMPGDEGYRGNGEKTEEVVSDE